VAAAVMGVGGAMDGRTRKQEEEEEPGLRNVCLGEVFEWSVVILVIQDK
jgi:hypothetical protein